MLPVGKFLEPNYGKLIPFIGLLILIFYLAYPDLSEQCHYAEQGERCKIGTPSCVNSVYDALSVCERTKALYSLGFTALSYIISCLFFLGFKVIRNEAYSYYYEQG
ncbi:MAG: hypothetical protein AABX01_01225 [Candidatus Micrarchaeota archaeon]